jgi:hypothetical protein
MGVDGFILSYGRANGNQVPSVSYINRISGWRIFLLATCLLAGFLLNLFLRPWRWRRYVPPKRRLKLNGLHGVIFQKMILFLTTAVKTSNPTYEAPQYAVSLGPPFPYVIPNVPLKSEEPMDAFECVTFLSRNRVSVSSNLGPETGYSKWDSAWYLQMSADTFSQATTSSLKVLSTERVHVALTLLIRIWVVHGSNLDWNLSWFSSVPSGECGDTVFQFVYRPTLWRRVV